LEFVSGKVVSANHAQLKFQPQDEFAELFDKSCLKLDFSK